MLFQNLYTVIFKCVANGFYTKGLISVELMLLQQVSNHSTAQTHTVQKQISLANANILLLTVQKLIQHPRGGMLSDVGDIIFNKLLEWGAPACFLAASVFQGSRH